MSNYDKQDVVTNNNHSELFSNAIRAGRRTYFFDVKSTKNNDYYLTITESKKRYDDNGNASFEKHKVFLYKEDFEKFSDGLNNAIEFIKNSKKEEVSDIETSFNGEDHSLKMELNTEAFSNIEFEDLSK